MLDPKFVRNNVDLVRAAIVNKGETVDLDRFSDINETLGRAAGDSILKQLADRLSSGLRGKGDQADLHRGLRMAVRVGGDEFALMLTDTVNEAFLSSFAERLLETVATPFRVDETEVYLTASVGVASASGDLSDPGELLQHAETAMHEAQRRGGGCYHVYSTALNGAVDFKLGMDRRLRAALERDELSLHYQPVVAAGSRRVLGVEAQGRTQVISANVPMAEVLMYAPDLISKTGGRGSFDMEFSHYEEVPPHLAEKIIAEAQAAREKE